MCTGCLLACLNLVLMQAFDELLLLKRGGRVIYNGPTGRDSSDLVTYFQHIQGVPKIEEGINPATWMLEVRQPAPSKACWALHPVVAGCVAACLS